MIRYILTWEDPEGVISEEVWNGGTGSVAFNFAQQRPAEAVEPEQGPVTTDPWGVTDGGYRG